jgi:probable HAF family extracellular repeat protein
MAYGTSGTQQVGSGSSLATGGKDHALLWNGSGDSFVDLHQFLSSDFIGSQAYGINGNGNIVGYAYDSSGYNHAILWEPVPEPATLLLLGLGAGILRRNAHKAGRL